MHKNESGGLGSARTYCENLTLAQTS